VTSFGTSNAAGESSRRLFVYNGGFLTNGRVKRILSLSGYDVKIGKPRAGDLVGAWGHSPTAPRAKAVADKTNTPILRVEDAFLRSVLTGRDGDAAMGLHIDTRGVHFDPAQPSDLEMILRDDPLDDAHLLTRARDGIAAIKRAHLSKYNAFDPATPAPDAGYVLVIDQTRGDAAVTASGADSNTFKEMLFYAQTEHPKARIIIKTHPETHAGHRGGYYGTDDTSDRISLLDTPLSPVQLFEGAIAVYTVSSQMGFEAILSGHKPVVFGQPFYIGWGLTEDRKPLDRRQRKLTRNQLFAAAMLIYPKWYDPFTDSLCSFETAVNNLTAAARTWRDDHAGWTAHGMRLWKRGPLQKFFGRYAPVAFAPKQGRGRHMVWAGKITPQQASAGFTRVEDGFWTSGRRRIHSAWHNRYHDQPRSIAGRARGQPCGGYHLQTPPRRRGRITPRRCARRPCHCRCGRDQCRPSGAAGQRGRGVDNDIPDRVRGLVTRQKSHLSGQPDQIAAQLTAPSHPKVQPLASRLHQSRVRRETPRCHPQAPPQATTQPAHRRLRKRPA